jgi:5-methyltetrahydrofolate corrinoid/iron sulfur protein methyltransferase
MCPLPLVLDTTNPLALDAGLAVRDGPSIINGFSMEPHKLDRILPLAAKYDADIVGYLLDPKSQVPTEPDEMMALKDSKCKSPLAVHQSDGQGLTGPTRLQLPGS